MLNRTITAATVLISVPGHLGLYSLMWVVFLSDYIFTIRQLPQIWRLVTSFFVTGPQLGLIMDPFFLYHYSSQLETGSPRFSAPGAYAFYILFVSTVIMVSKTVHSVVSFASTFFPLHNSTSDNLPALLPVALTVPGTEEDHPCTVRRSSFAKYKERLAECGHGGIIRIEITVFPNHVDAGGYWTLHIFVAKLHVGLSHRTLAWRAVEPWRHAMHDAPRSTFTALCQPLLRASRA